MKSKYLKDLSNLLDDYQMDIFEKQDIINDYSNMYDEWVEKGYYEEEVEKKLGHPKSIIKDLTEGHRKLERPLPGSEKVIAISPFITTIIFLILGFGFDLWHPGWLVFLLIPVTAILVSMGKTKDEHITTALSPFGASVIFLLLGFFYGLWHPGWLVFLIIPVLAIWNSRYSMRKIDLLTSLSPFIAVLAYVVLGMYGYWLEGWLVFMLIPMLGILNYPKKSIMLLWELLAIVGIIGYLYIGLTFEHSWQYACLSFVPFIIMSLVISDWKNSEKMSKIYLSISVLSTIAFAFVGYFFGLWAISWLFFLIIPVYAISTETKNKEKTVALSPFLAVTIFMLLGYFFDLWHISWIIFIIIPMTAILKDS